MLRNQYSVSCVPKMSRTMKQLFLFAAQLGGLALNLLLLVHAQDQSAFISIDCGLEEDSRNIDNPSGITYISDENFVATGERKLVLPEYKNKCGQSYNSLRSFPEGTRNCYKINVTSKTKYLIRAGFFYGNYDEQNEVPEFEIHLGPNLWGTVKSDPHYECFGLELIHVPLRNYVHVCLVKTDSGVPFISVLSLRPLTDASYNTVKGSLSLIGRRDTGLTADHWGYRYPDDIHDRFWLYFDDNSPWTKLNTSSTINSEFEYQPPSVVMGTAATPNSSSDPLNIFWETDTEVYHVYLHFAEIEKLQPNQSRQFNITTNGELCHGTLAPDYLSTTTIFCTAKSLSGLGVQNNLSIIKTGNSTLPPILNAYEIFKVKELLISDTNQDDVEAITNIKSTYNIEKNWQGDPCNPRVYSWYGLNCSYHGNDPPRIISLNLSSSKLEGEISPSLSNLTMIQALDLSNNNLRGSIPEILSQLPTLSILNLESNNLTGSIPVVLIERWKDGLLSISLCENPNLSGNVPCNKKNRKYNFFVMMIIVSVVALSVLLLSVAAIWYQAASKRKRQHGNSTDANVAIQQGLFERKGRQFTYSEIVQITEEFKRVLGKGGFGTVYHGHIDDTQVAVKMLSPSSEQGFLQFLTEVDLLMRVHHRNLTSLIGYCNDETNIGLIYEYMANGNLQEHLSGSRSNILSWGDRVQIAIEAAQGLEYLHYGCRPPIIHRDVKSTNILLNEKFEAKLSDFGISRSFPTEDGTHITTTNVVGTPGYLDPEYYASNILKKESDVYSFGIVLLEIISSRPVMHERRCISEWFSFRLQKGDIYSIVDPRLEGKFNTNSVWKAVEIANACISPIAIKRLSMSQVVVDLKECLATELARTNLRHETELRNSIAMLQPSVR